MTSGPTSIASDAMAVDAARRMLSEDVGSLPVVEEDRLVGMVTDRDLVLQVMAKDLDPSLRVALMVGRAGGQIDELLSGYQDVPRLSKPIGFAALYARLRELLGPPAMSPTRPSSPQARPRSSRRPSGKFEL